ncbi:MAG: hypothetical protein IAE81_09925 [Caldilineaceae bacterium]|nr:hypothetical protein [Caldilineaceae bacterium]
MKLAGVIGASGVVTPPVVWRARHKNYYPAEMETVMVYPMRRTWMLPLLCFVAWSSAACVVQPIQPAHLPANEAGIVGVTSAPLAGFSYAGPAAPGSDDASKCASLLLASGGEATVSDCTGNVTTIDLDESLLARWSQMQERFAAFVVETPTERLAFTGTGAIAGDAWQRALLAWARTQYAVLSSGKVSAAGNTVLAWDLGPLDDAQSSCMHLTVLAWGEAYAETRPCTGGDVQALKTGWLETAELEQLDAWLTSYAPLNTPDGYVAGAGVQTTRAGDLAAIEAWVASVWHRLWISGPP